MEKPPLEKVIERLEKLDIREWRYEYVKRDNRLATRISGMVIYLYKDTNVIPAGYHLEFKHEYAEQGIEYGSLKKEKELVKKFYEKIHEVYNKHKEEELQERLNNFLSD